MNKKYMDPEMKVTLFESVDVITASTNKDDEDYFEDDMIVNNNITGI